MSSSVCCRCSRESEHQQLPHPVPPGRAAAVPRPAARPALPRPPVRGVAGRASAAMFLCCLSLCVRCPHYVSSVCAVCCPTVTPPSLQTSHQPRAMLGTLKERLTSRLGGRRLGPGPAGRTGPGRAAAREAGAAVLTHYQQGWTQIHCVAEQAARQADRFDREVGTNYNKYFQS